MHHKVNDLTNKFSAVQLEKGGDVSGPVRELFNLN